MDAGFADFDITLRDGRAVHIRAMRPSDEAEFLQAFARLDADARHMRFMRAVNEPNQTRLRKVLASFPAAASGSWRRSRPQTASISWAALSPCSRATARVASSRSPSPRNLAGAGLQPLMTTLIDTARRRGIGEMEGSCWR